MSYLGFQVADLESCEEEVRAWLKTHEQDTLQISTKTPVGYGWTESCAGDLSDLDNADFADFKAFEDCGNFCIFTTIKHAYRVQVVDLPSDKWGNTATYEEEPNCIWINFQNDSGNYNNEKIDFDVLVDGETYSYKENSEEFVDWAENQGVEEDERFSLIHEEVICNGTSCSWHYVTLKDLDSLKRVFSEWIASEE